MLGILITIYKMLVNLTKKEGKTMEEAKINYVIVSKKQHIKKENLQDALSYLHGLKKLGIEARLYAHRQYEVVSDALFILK